MVARVPSDEGYAEALVDFLVISACTDLGLDPATRIAPAGQVMADAIRCRLLLWCDGTDERPEVVALVHALGTTVADLVDRAGVQGA